MKENIKNTLIGIFALVSIVSFVAIIMFLEPSIGDGKKTLTTRFSNISGITVGTRVSFAGKPVGEVVQIKTLANAREEGYDEQGKIYFFEVVLKVDSSVEVFSTDEIKIITTGLMGEKSIAIIPGPQKNNEIVEKMTNRTIFAKSTDPLDNTFNQLSTLSTKLNRSIDSFNGWFSQNYYNLNQALDSFSKFANNLEAEKFNLALDNFSSSLEKADLLLASLQNSSSSLGMLIRDDNFYLQLSAIMNKSNLLLNDINHYGLLFQYDKGWQRTRTKRANSMNSISTSKGFKEYFERELDAITASIERLTTLLDKSKDLEDQKNLGKELQFLMKRFEATSATLKLFVQDLTFSTNN